MRYIERLGLYTTKERNVIKMVDYNEIANTQRWDYTKVKKALTDSFRTLCARQFSKCLGLEGSQGISLEPIKSAKKLIQRDYEIMRENVLAGINLREGDHVFFATCPKHGGGYLKHAPLESPNSALAEHPKMGKAEKRGYCIKREAFIKLIADTIDAPLIQKGRSIGITADYLEV